MATSSELEEKINTQVFKIHTLKTRSVTLYLTRASVVRDIENVKIKPGRNKISIIGLSTLVDENTIKIEGHGTHALITDTVVETVPNPRDDEELSEEEEEKDPECERLLKEIKELDSQIEDAQERTKSCSNQITYMEKHATSLSSNTELATAKMAESIKVYGEIREKVWAEYKAAQNSTKTLMEERDRKAREHQKAWGKWQDKTKDEKRRKWEEKSNRPQSVQKVTVTIELDTLPKATEYVESYISTGKPARADDDEPPKSSGPSLRISYVIGGASWRPRYDIRLDTTSETALLTYRAEFSNNTGETWTDAEVTLSTSQTSFTGIEDRVPWLDSWRMSLQKDGNKLREDAAQELYSVKEKQIRQGGKKRRELALLSREGSRAACLGTPHALPSYAPPPPPPPPPVTSGHSGFGSAVEAAAAPSVLSVENIVQHSYPGSSQSTHNPMLRTMALQSQQNTNNSSSRRILHRRLSSAPATRFETDGNPDEEDSEDDTIDMPRKMGLATSKSESYGLTTTYDLPGARTIPSSRLVRHHVIQELTLRNVEFSHISVPKLRAAAFLKAKITNSSTIPLLYGSCGLTVDGSFLGNSNVDRCAPGGAFELSLGIDEEVLVAYRKPVRKMASQGMLSREHVATYERSISVHNTKRKKIDVLLFDQVPVSEDERLKIALLTPRVREEGTMTNMDYRSTGGGHVSVGRMLKKGGEIRFQVSLENGEGVVLPVEYEAKFPMSEHIALV